MHSPTRVRILIVSLALLLAALACTLEIGGEGGGSSTPQTVDRPVVEIFEPLNGATFTVSQNVAVRARATSASGVTLVQLLVNGVTVASQPPAEAINPTTLDVVLDYKPDRAGTLTLAVLAYSNTVVGQPAQRTITILPDLAAGAGGTAANTLTALPPSATPYDPRCRARINTNLNFRDGPSVKYGIIATFSAGQEPPIIGYADGPDGDGRWWQVQSGSRTGWVFANFTTQLGECGTIRPATYPALPTPTPTNTPLPGATSTPTLPDLQFTLLEGPNEIVLNERGEAQATYILDVTNRGGTTAGAFRVAVLTPSGDVQYFDVGGLAPGQTQRVPGTGVTVIFRNPGFTRILVTVDDNNRVAESNEGNNQAYRDISVRYGPATITPVVPPTNPPPPTATPPPTPIPLPTDTPVPQQGSGLQSLLPITVQNASAVTVLAALQEHGGAITGLAYHPAGTMLASASRDGTVRLWDTFTNAELADLPHTDSVTGLAFSPDGSRLASVTQGGSVHVWATANGAELMRFEHGAQALSVAISPDGSRVAAGGNSPTPGGGLAGMARVWDLGTGAELATVETFGPVTGVGFVNASTLVVGSQGQSCEAGGGAVELFVVPGGTSLGTFNDASGWINALAVLPATGQIAASGQEIVCGGNGLVWIWHGSGSLLAMLDHGASTEVTSLAFSAGGSLLASTTSDGLVWLWNAAGGAQLATLAAHDSALSVAFSPDGKLVASGGADGVIRLWGVR